MPFINPERIAKYNRSRVDRVLKSYGMFRGMKIFSDITFEYKGKNAHVDHILAGYFGVLFITSVTEEGSFYGDAKADKWTYAPDKFSKKYINNPIKANDEAIAIFKAICAESKTYGIIAEGIAVFMGRPKKTELFITGQSTALNLEQLKKRLRLPKYESDNNIDLQALSDLIARFKPTGK